MKKELNFTKMVASGNDFVVIDKEELSTIHYPLSTTVKQICNRKYGVGADGLLVLEKSKRADISMRIFNADGSEAEMCGNGARCVAYYLSQNASLRAPQGRSNPCIDTKAGIIDSLVKKENIRIKLTVPHSLKLGIPVSINGRRINVNFINTGVPHAVILVEGLDKLDVAGIGRKIRYHRKFIPAGTNVDFVEILSKDSIKVRTYERGVEDETLACGTGSVAAALLSTIHYPLSTIHKVNVMTRSGEILKVYFDRDGDSFKNVWLEGRASIVYKGEYYV